MDILKELVSVVNKNKVKSLRTIDSIDKEELVYDFYDKLTKDTFKDDHAAANFYFNSDEKDPQYRKLKNKLKDRLINTIFFIDSSSAKFSNAQKAFYQCHKELSSVKLLLGRNARNVAIEIAKNTLKFTKKYELVDLTIEILNILRSHHALYTGNKNIYNRIVKELNYYQPILDAENLAIKYYDDLNVNFVNSISSKEDNLNLADKYINELNTYITRFKTFRLHLVYYWLYILRETIAINYQGIVDVCERALSFFKTKPNVSTHFISVFYYHKLIGYTNLQNFAKGKEIAEICLATYEDGSLRWFRTMDLYFTLCLHTENYQLALNLYSNVQSNSNFKYQFEYRIEMWKIYEAYLYYLYIIGLLKLSKSHQLIKNFRINKFINEVPVFSTDKRGYNIPILIVQILILIHNKKFDRLYDKIEAIEKYSSRYLKKDNNFRSNCFIKMLLQIPKRHFHKAGVILHTKQYYKKLLDKPLKEAKQAYEIEIIPYEKLWNYTVDSLENKFITL